MEWRHISEKKLHIFKSGLPVCRSIHCFYVNYDLWGLFHLNTRWIPWCPLQEAKVFADTQYVRHFTAKDSVPESPFKVMVLIFSQNMFLVLFTHFFSITVLYSHIPFKKKESFFLSHCYSSSTMLMIKNQCKSFLACASCKTSDRISAM